MLLFLAIICSIACLASGDVAHLGRQYLPPARNVEFNSAQRYTTGNNFGGERFTQVQVVPSTSFAFPAAQLPTYSRSSSSFSNEYRAPARFTAASTSSGYSDNRFHSARLAVPSRQYLSPEVETFEPLVQKTYSAPVITYNAPAASSAFTASANLDTKYSADGGYVY